MTTPQYELPAEMRDLVEKSVAQVRSMFEGIMSASQTAAGQVDTTVVSAQGNAKEFGMKAMSYAESNTRSIFDLAQKLVQAKDWQEVFRLQSDYARTQMATIQGQAKELGTMVRHAGQNAEATTQQAVRHEEALLDQSLEESFPASDPVASNRFD